MLLAGRASVHTRAVQAEQAGAPTPSPQNPAGYLDQASVSSQKGVSFFMLLAGRASVHTRAVQAEQAGAPTPSPQNPAGYLDQASEPVISRTHRP
jgi:hypothetical protein